MYKFKTCLLWVPKSVSGNLYTMWKILRRHYSSQLPNITVSILWKIFLPSVGFSSFAKQEEAFLLKLNYTPWSSPDFSRLFKLRSSVGGQAKYLDVFVLLLSCVFSDVVSNENPLSFFVSRTIRCSGEFITFRYWKSGIFWSIF